MSKSQVHTDDIIYARIDEGRPDGDHEIETFVFLDFESTGFLKQRAKITEMCLLAVSRQDLSDSKLPRVQNKLTLCFNPDKQLTQSASEVSGLSYDMLNHQKPMTSKSVDLINAFLGHLQEPICLLAHWGNGFDFPLLMAELYSIGQSKALHSSLLCADTLDAFKYLQDFTPVATEKNSASRPEKRRSTSSTSDLDEAPLKKAKSLPAGSNPKGASKKATHASTKMNAPTMKKSESMPTPGQSSSFKLKDIYFRAFGKYPPKGHTAEGDCVALLKIAQRSPGFIPWVDENARKVSSIKPGYT